MDNGQVIQGLGDDWTFLGAKLTEWVAGFVSGIMVQELLFAGKSNGMPFVLATMIGVAYSMAGFRSRFPDEERGMRNYIMTAIGLCPPGIPAPASLQPVWSGAPTREVKPTCAYNELGLDELFIQGEIDPDLAQAKEAQAMVRLRGKN